MQDSESRENRGPKMVLPGGFTFGEIFVKSLKGRSETGVRLTCVFGESLFTWMIPLLKIENNTRYHMLLVPLVFGGVQQVLSHFFPLTLQGFTTSKILDRKFHISLSPRTRPLSPLYSRHLLRPYVNPKDFSLSASLDILASRA